MTADKRDLREIGPWSICLGRSLKRAVLVVAGLYLALTLFQVGISTATILTGHPGFASSYQSEPIEVTMFTPTPSASFESQ